MKIPQSFAVLSVLALACQALAVTVVVPGTSDPWLAGMPNGSSASFNPGSGEPADFAPAQSPVLVPGLCLDAGAAVTWTASGVVGHPGDPAGPDGATGANFAHFNGAENGISDITVPIDSLLGVFLDGSQPDLSPAPGPLDFSAAASRDYTSLAPALKQVFFMGDGMTSGSVAQQLIVPPGATRLYLGTMDGYSWNNNNGSFVVDLKAACPETLPYGWLSLAGIVILGALERRRAAA